MLRRPSACFRGWLEGLHEALSAFGQACDRLTTSDIVGACHERGAVYVSGRKSSPSETALWRL
jgi:hypothetical protein